MRGVDAVNKHLALRPPIASPFMNTVLEKIASPNGYTQLSIRYAPLFC
jgi:hypothetical protein